MTGPSARVAQAATAAVSRRYPRLVYAAAMVLLFVPLYLLTRSPLLASDGHFYVRLARAGGGEPKYAEVGHFLQVPLSHGLWVLGQWLGLPVPVEAVFLGLALTGALAAIVFVGLIAGDLIEASPARWVAGLLFGTSLAVWTQWNGELYTLGLGFVSAAVYMSLRRRPVFAAALFALAVVAHSEFTLVGLAFFVSTWLGVPAGTGTRRRLTEGALVVGLAAAMTLAILLAGGWVLQKWHDVDSLRAWFFHAYQLREGDLISPEPLRAAKGLVTAYNVGGHFLGDIVMRRAPEGNLWFTIAAGAAAGVIATTIAMIFRAVRRPALLVLSLAWLLPVHLLFNWRFNPTVEEYHAAAIPALVLLVTGGLFAARRATGRPARGWLAAIYVGLCVGLNLVAGVLPVRAFADGAFRGADALVALGTSAPHGAAFVSCDDDPSVSLAGVDYLRVRVVWARTRAIPDSERAIVAWVAARLAEGKDVYVIGRSCPLSSWVSDAPQPSLALAFLDRSFVVTATPVTGLLSSPASITNPFGWRRDDVYRLVLRTEGAGRP